MECVTCVCVWIGAGVFCSNLLHFIDICFITCICMWQISQIQTCLRVFVGPGFVSTSPAFMRSSTIHPAGPHDWLAKNGNRAPISGGRSCLHNLYRVCQTIVTAQPCVVWSLSVLSSTLFNIYTADFPPPRVPVQVMAYVDTYSICLDKT